MPAKIRTIKANIAEINYIDPWTDKILSESESYNRKSYAIFEFNKSLNYKGGTLGKIKIYEKKEGCVKIKIKEDLNGDGKFGEDELIYKGKIKEVEDVDALINFEGAIKVKKQMHSCDWKKQKNPDKEIICTQDYIEEFTVLTLDSIGWGPFNYPMWSGTLLLPNDEPNTSSIGGGGGAGGTIV